MKNTIDMIIESIVDNGNGRVDNVPPQSHQKQTPDTSLGRANVTHPQAMDAPKNPKNTPKN